MFTQEENMGISDTPTVLRISEELRIWTVGEDVESTLWMKRTMTTLGIYKGVGCRITLTSIE